MKWALFYHSLLSDWNHGNAHFLRGIVRELVQRGETVTVHEPADGWSRANLVENHGEAALREVEQTLGLEGLHRSYTEPVPDLDRLLDDVDVILVHEWNTPELVKAVGEYRRRHPEKRLLFHDTHHRAVSEPEAMGAYCLDEYDGALVFGRALQRVYAEREWVREAWTWHEAADTSWFYPRERSRTQSDIVWIGNWGDGERSRELEDFLFQPVEQLKLKGSIHGVRYPDHARLRVEDAGLKYRSWLPNHRAPETFARYRFTVHIPRRFYTTTLPGIPTIRPFEALACGIPLICSPWDDAEGLFSPGEDFLMVSNGSEMKDAMQAVVSDEVLAEKIAARGLRTLRERHTCAHRVEELLLICRSLGLPDRMAAKAS